MVNKLDDFPEGHRLPMNWKKYADGSIYEFTPADNLYTDPEKFRTNARMWARRHGYTLTSSLIPNEEQQPSVVIRFMKI